MHLPPVDDAARYRGLYVCDFGEFSAVGYTAEELATLLESEAYRDARVYKIVRSTPQGGFELRGVPVERFQLESGLIFSRQCESDARRDFDALRTLGAGGAAPCRAFVRLVDRGAAAEFDRFVTALIYPAEHDDEISRWLLDAQFDGGDTVEGGVSRVTDFYHEPHTVLDRAQLWSQTATPSRSREELEATIRRAVQR